MIDGIKTTNFPAKEKISSNDTVLANIGGKTSKITVENFFGKIGEEGLTLKKGYITSEYRGDNHPIGWACMAKIEVFDSTYIDQPIEFKISRRETEGKVINRV